MNYNKKSVEDIDVAGKRVLCRCDFNVPTKDGRITSDKRIVAALPTIQYLVKHGARVILCSHMGKPKGEVKPELSLQVVAERLSELLGQPVKMAKDVEGESAQAQAASHKDGEGMLRANTRCETGFTMHDPELSMKLASMADIFVNDAFGTAHRAHASTAGVADYLPAVSGYLVQKEVSIMGKALADPERPFVAILGGAKVSDKLNVINNLLEKVDTLIINGAECEPYLNGDHLTMKNHPEELLKGIELARIASGLDKAYYGIEKNKQDAIDLLNSLTNTKCQNDHRNHKSYDLPEIVSNRRCHGFTRSGKILYAHS